MMDLAAELYPIRRSLTGDGVRATLERIARRIPLQVQELPTGTPVLDWTVPREWNPREAWIRDPSGRRVVDFADHELHLVGYSVPVHRRLPLNELRTHLHSLPEHPDLIPYRTSYYEETWGFCLPHRLLASLREGEYEVLIDASLEDGSMTWGECLLPGSSAEEVLISSHVCHPQLANDNLSGIAVAVHLAEALARVPERRYSYRFLFAPGGIGAIAWLARNRDRLDSFRHGLIAANLGDGGGFHYKKSRRGDREIDRAVVAALAGLGEDLVTEGFFPFGYDERQYCSPGFDLPVGVLTRTPWGRYLEYHTSADDLSFIGAEALAGSLAAYLATAAVLEEGPGAPACPPAAVEGGRKSAGGRRYRNLEPFGEPQLGRRGLYGGLGGAGRKDFEIAMLWVLNQSDGEHSLDDIAERSGLPPGVVGEAADALRDAGLLERLA
ncbi:MAG: DUF4910 domain-containing protein [Holophagales bacterium]|nr:DUF4910 domain-containing protein [Holophagales bacterium]MYD23975.1 DUF4910 domain-containing protein [Holophagales bacterium]MYI33472.1 DUF4910 domain-containing protein [Holophagales bacterium]